MSLFYYSKVVYELDFDTIFDLLEFQLKPVKFVSRVDPVKALCDRVLALELAFEEKEKEKKRLKKKEKSGKKSCKFIAEIKEDGVIRKYVYETSSGSDKNKDKKNKDKEHSVEDKKVPTKNVGAKKSYKWSAEIKDDDDVSRKYTIERIIGSDKEDKKVEKKKDKKKERLVEIEEVAPDHGAMVLRQAFAKRARALERNRGKRNELSPEEAAIIIQTTFKAYIVKKSQTLRALRELAVAKARLKELRKLFNNFTYRRHVTRDAEERQRFTEKIIVLLLTVDTIEGVDVMVRSVKRSMIHELEAMLDVVEPQPAEKARLERRRTFDLPDGTIQKELAAGVADVVQMLGEDDDSS